MKTFVLRFIHTPGIVSGVIDYVEDGHFDHCECGGHSQEEVDAGTPQTWIGAHMHGGVEERPADYCKPNRERRYGLPMADAVFDRCMDYERSKIGDSYNLWDDIGIALHTEWRSKHGLICSWLQFNATSIWSKTLDPPTMMLNLLPGRAHLVTPELLLLSPYLQGRLIYQFPEEK